MDEIVDELSLNVSVLIDEPFHQVVDFLFGDLRLEAFNIIGLVQGALLHST